MNYQIFAILDTIKEQFYYSRLHHVQA